MLTRLRVRNFKTLEDIDIPLGQNVVLIGPNNSGKTSALQALALWRTGVLAWASGVRRTGSPRYVINRKELVQTPADAAESLWTKQTHAVTRGELLENVLIQITVDGENGGQAWSCSLEFQVGNRESIVCSPSDETFSQSQRPPMGVLNAGVAFLPPMSGLALEEAELQPGRIAALIGEGQTAQILRNLCLRVFESSQKYWDRITEDMHRMFGVEMHVPDRFLPRGIVELLYSEKGQHYDITSAGRGMQQTLLLLAHIYANPGSTLLLDEPDAHLEILRQRQIYSLVTETARRMGSQVIAASHSEVLLNEAADKDVVIAFVGNPHRMDDRGSQVLKSLTEIGFEQYYQAEAKGFVIYLEGSTDLSILRALARKLGHPASQILEDAPFIHYVANHPSQAERHFQALREAKRNLKGFAVFDRLGRPLRGGFAIPCVQWRRREIENYLCSRDILIRYAEGMEPSDLVEDALRLERRAKMLSAIAEIESALGKLNKGDPWSADFKVSDDFLPPLFVAYFNSLGAYNRMSKSNYHELAEFIEPGEIDADVIDCLDKLVAAAS